MAPRLWFSCGLACGRPGWSSRSNNAAAHTYTHIRTDFLGAGFFAEAAARFCAFFGGILAALGAHRGEGGGRHVEPA